MERSKSDELWSRALLRNPGGVHSPVRAFGNLQDTPLFIESASGAELTDADDNRYTDYCMAFGPLILGHRNERVAAEVAAALNDGWSYGTAERYSLDLAELISTEIPAAEMIRFVNSGTEAVMTALRIARGATGRDRILKFAGCYHGHTDAMLIDAGSGMAGTPASAGIPASVAADTLVIPLDDETKLLEVFSEHGDSIAAAIIEPLPANYGLLPQRQAFLNSLAEQCRKAGALLIFDEVISGFRVAFGGCTSQTGIEPDLRTWGKIIGGGFPVGAIAGRQELMQHLAPTGKVYQAGTLSANPVAMRAGYATLRHLLEDDVYTTLEALGARLETGIRETTGINIVRQGSVFWLCHATDARTAADCEHALLPDYAVLHKHFLAQGIYLAPSPYEVNFLSIAHTDKDIDKLISACCQFLNSE